MTTKMRIATVKSTGDIYLVQQMHVNSDPKLNRVHCWGEVVSYKTSRATTRAKSMELGASTKHSASKIFFRDAVEISEIVITGHVAQKLLDQAEKNLKGQPIYRILSERNVY